MFTLKNPEKTDNWFVDLKNYSEVEATLPLDSINVRNDSNNVLYLDLWGRKVGEIQRYSSDGFMGREFEDFRIYNPDKNTFEKDDVFVQVSKGQMMSSLPFNPQWDAMEEDLDSYARGCDARTTLGATNTIEIVKYLLNSQNNIIVQKRISVQGSAAMGTYDTDFEGDLVSGDVGINAVVLDTTKIRKTLHESALNFHDTNCTISGLMFDYKKCNDASVYYTIVSGANAERVYDDDLAVYAEYYADPTTWVTTWEVSLNAVNISAVHCLCTLKNHNSTKTSYMQLQLNASGVWTTVLTADVHGTTYVYKYLHNLVDRDVVTGARVQQKSNAILGSAYRAYTRLYDITLIER